MTTKTFSLFFALLLIPATVFGQEIGFEEGTAIVETDNADVNVDVTGLSDGQTLTGAQFDINFSGATNAPTITKEYDRGNLSTNVIDETNSILRVLVFSGTGADDIQADNVVNAAVDNILTENQELDITDAVITVEESDGTTTEINPTIGTSPVVFKEGVVDLNIQESNVDFGNVIAGNTSTSQITVENNGTVDAESVTASANGDLFATEGVPSTIPTGGSETVDVTFSPTRTKFSDRSSTVEVSSGESTASASAEGLGIGGRGDADLNGFIDVSDITLSADFVLENPSPGADEKTAADVFPIDQEGDGTLTVTDVQSTANATVQEQWPDGVSVPLNTDNNVSSFGIEKSSTRNARVEFQETRNGTNIVLKNPSFTRGLQLNMLAEKTSFDQNEESNLEMTFANPESGRVKLIAYNSQSEAVNKDSVILGTLSGHVSKAEALGVDINNSTFNIETEIIENVNENKITATPMPVQRTLTININLKEQQRGRLSIYDVLGREIEVLEKRRFRSGKSQVTTQLGNLSSGTYFLKFEGEKHAENVKLTVSR